MGGARTRWIALALLAVAWLAFVYPAFSGKVHFPTDFGYPYYQAPSGHVAHPSNQADTDTFNALYPWRAYLGQQLSQGHLPLWDPTRFLGVPYAADISMGAFYPPNWLYAFGSVAGVATLVWMLTILASLLLTFWFLSVLRLHPYAAAFGAIAWTFCGFMMAWSTEDPLLGAAVWLPLVLGGLEVARKGRWRWGIPLAGLGLALSALAGHAQISYYVWLSAAMWVGVATLVDALRRRSEGRAAILGELRRGVLIGGGAFAVGLGLAAVQVLGTLEYTGQIVRQHQTYASVVLYKVQPKFLALSVLPDYFGNPVNSNYLYGAYGYTSTAYYAGILALPLAAAGLVHRRREASLAFALLVLVGVACAFGTPLFHIMFAVLPGLNRFQGINRILVLVDMGLAGLAALGLDGLLGAAPRVPARVALVVAAVAAALVGGLAVFRWSTSLPAGYLEGRAGRELAILALGAICVVLLARRTPEGTGPPLMTAGVALVCLVGVDLWTFGFSYHPFQPNYPPTTTSAELQYLASVAGTRPRYAQANGYVLSPNASMVYGLYSLHGYDPFIPEDFVRLISTVDPVLGVLAKSGNALFPLPIAGTEPPLLDLLGVKSITSAPAAVEPGVQGHAGGFAVWEQPAAFPAAFVVGCWSVGSDGAALAFAGSSSVAELRAGAVVAPGTGAASLGSPTPGCNAGPDATVGHYWAQDVELAVPSSSAGGLLVLGDEWYPGWTATVDGRPVPVLRVDEALRAVRIGPGAHSVVFAYQPRWPLEGLAITLLTVVLVLFSAAGGWERVRRPLSQARSTETLSA